MTDRGYIKNGVDKTFTNSMFKDKGEKIANKIIEIEQNIEKLNMPQDKEKELFFGVLKTCISRQSFSINDILRITKYFYEDFRFLPNEQTSVIFSSGFGIINEALVDTIKNLDLIKTPFDADRLMTEGKDIASKYEDKKNSVFISTESLIEESPHSDEVIEEFLDFGEEPNNLENPPKVNEITLETGEINKSIETDFPEDEMFNLNLVDIQEETPQIEKEEIKKTNKSTTEVSKKTEAPVETGFSAELGEDIAEVLSSSTQNRPIELDTNVTDKKNKKDTTNPPLEPKIESNLNPFGREQHETKLPESEFIRGFGLNYGEDGERVESINENNIDSAIAELDRILKIKEEPIEEEKIDPEKQKRMNLFMKGIESTKLTDEDKLTHYLNTDNECKQKIRGLVTSIRTLKDTWEIYLKEKEIRPIAVEVSYQELFERLNKKNSTDLKIFGDLILNKVDFAIILSIISGKTIDSDIYIEGGFIFSNEKGLTKEKFLERIKNATDIITPNIGVLNNIIRNIKFLRGLGFRKLFISPNFTGGEEISDRINYLWEYIITFYSQYYINSNLIDKYKKVIDDEYNPFKIVELKQKLSKKIKNKLNIQDLKVIVEKFERIWEQNTEEKIEGYYEIIDKYLKDIITKKDADLLLKKCESIWEKNRLTTNEKTNSEYLGIWKKYKKNMNESQTIVLCNLLKQIWKKQIDKKEKGMKEVIQEFGIIDKTETRIIIEEYEKIRLKYFPKIEMELNNNEEKMKQFIEEKIKEHYIKIYNDYQNMRYDEAIENNNSTPEGLGGPKIQDLVFALKKQINKKISNLSDNSNLRLKKLEPFEEILSDVDINFISFCIALEGKFDPYLELLKDRNTSLWSRSKIFQIPDDSEKYKSMAKHAEEEDRISFKESALEVNEEKKQMALARTAESLNFLLMFLFELDKAELANDIRRKKNILDLTLMNGILK
ncbi:MAG: hypothetical protein WC356_04500 [Candidatus Micrarchaeia archaeon]|jgi:hypothetical protein